MDARPTGVPSAETPQSDGSRTRNFSARKIPFSAKATFSKLTPTKFSIKENQLTPPPKDQSYSSECSKFAP